MRLEPKPQNFENDGTMNRVYSFQEFLDRSQATPSLLFIREDGCPYCEMAKEILTEALTPEFANIQLFEIKTSDTPGLTIDLGLTGVPAFVLKNSEGRIKIKVGLCNSAELQNFVVGAM